MRFILSSRAMAAWSTPWEDARPARLRSRSASSHGLLQVELVRELRMKRTPTLEFVYDESIERGMRISELLDEGGGA